MFSSAFMRRLILGAALLATVVASVWPRGDEKLAPEVVAPVSRGDMAPSREQRLPVQLELPKLDERLERLHTPEKLQDLFGTTDWNPPPPREQKPPPPPPPAAPPFPYTVAGSVVDAAGPMIVFNRQNQDFVLRAGDVLEHTYRIETIDARSVTVTYLPLGLTQVVSLERFK